MSAKPNKTQLKELKEDCIVESTLKIWFEIGGKGGGKQKKKKGETVEIELSGMGVDEEKGRCTPIERLKTRQAYDRLIRTRMKLKNYKPRKGPKAHKIVQGIQKQMKRTNETTGGD